MKYGFPVDKYFDELNRVVDQVCDEINIQFGVFPLQSTTWVQVKVYVALNNEITSPSE